MAPLRALCVLLLAVAATSAARIPAPQEQSIENAVQELTAQIGQIQNLARNRGVTSNAIANGIKRLKELVEKIREKVREAEKNLAEGAQDFSEAIMKKINEGLKKLTGHDFGLEDGWKAFEEKTKGCSSSLQSELKEILTSVKKEAKKCSATQFAQVAQIKKQLVKLTEILESIPVTAFKNIKKCVKGDEPDDDDEPSDDGEDDQDEDDEDAEEDGDHTNPNIPDDTVDDDDEEEDADDGDNTNPNIPDTVFEMLQIQNNAVNSFSFLETLKRAKCVADELFTAANGLREVPKLVYYLNQEIRDVTSKDSRDALLSCANKAVDGKATMIQKSVAELAYCLVAPSA